MSSWRHYKPAPPRFENGAVVRVKGSPVEQMNLYGRAVAGEHTLGVIVQPHRRSHGATRYRVHFPAHTYYSPIQQRSSHIAECEIVVREEHLEEVEVIAGGQDAMASIEAEVGR